MAITQQRTMQDFAPQVRWLLDEAYPDVPVTRLVLDNLNTHSIASLYEPFPSAEARRIAKRLEFHHTPKHGNWLDMADVEFGVCGLVPVSRGATPARTPCRKTSAPIRRSPTWPEPPSTGGSQPRTPEPKWVASILTFQLCLNNRGREV